MHTDLDGHSILRQIAQMIVSQQQQQLQQLKVTKSSLPCEKLHACTGALMRFWIGGIIINLGYERTHILVTKLLLLKKKIMLRVSLEGEPKTDLHFHCQFHGSPPIFLPLDIKIAFL